MNRTIKAIMAITADYVRQVFKGLESGDGAEFFAHVADDVDWIVEGTHPLRRIRSHDRSNVPNE